MPTFTHSDDLLLTVIVGEVTLNTPWNTWQEHELVWTPGSSDWYVDGEHVASIQFQAPVDPSILIFNSWSDGGSWTGESKLATTPLYKPYRRWTS